MTAQGEVAIAFGIDDGYAPHLAAIIASIVRHAPDASFRFIVLHVGVAEARRTRVESVAPNARFTWTEVAEDDLPAFAGGAHLTHINRTTLFRLGLERLAPSDCGRVLYLDTDMIVTRDIRELWSIDLGDRPLAAAPDCWMDAAEFGERWGLPAQSLGYFNAGALLIDLERVRAEELFTKALRFFAENGPNLPYNDQDALNVVFWGRWRPAAPMWNAQINMVLYWTAPELPEPLQFHETLPAIIHYTGPEKPWTRGGYHPYSWIYWDNLARTPFLAEVIAASGIGPLERLRIWARWMRRRPAKRARADAPVQVAASG